MWETYTTEAETGHYCCLVAKSCLTLCDPVDCSPTRLLCPWDFPGKSTVAGCHFLLQGIFPTQGLSHVSCTRRQILYHWATREAHKTLLKEIQNDINKWKHISCSWIGRQSIKMSILVKVIYRFSATLTKILKTIFSEIEKSILKFKWNLKEQQVVKIILTKKNKIAWPTLPACKTYYKVTVIRLYGIKRASMVAQW